MYICIYACVRVGKSVFGGDIFYRPVKDSPLPTSLHIGKCGITLELSIRLLAFRDIDFYFGYLSIYPFFEIYSLRFHLPPEPSSCLIATVVHGVRRIRWVIHPKTRPTL